MNGNLDVVMPQGVTHVQVLAVMGKCGFQVRNCVVSESPQERVAKMQVKYKGRTEDESNARRDALRMIEAYEMETREETYSH